jgi:acyl-CoA-binding protein
MAEEDDFTSALSTCEHLLDGVVPNGNAVTEFGAHRFLSLDRETHLRLYALRKQVQVGPCTEATPLFFLREDVKACFLAWKSLGDLVPESARGQFVQLVAAHRPSPADSGSTYYWFEQLRWLVAMFDIDDSSCAPCGPACGVPRKTIKEAPSESGGERKPPPNWPKTVEPALPLADTSAIMADFVGEWALHEDLGSLRAYLVGIGLPGFAAGMIAGAAKIGDPTFWALDKAGTTLLRTFKRGEKSEFDETYALGETRSQAFVGKEAVQTCTFAGGVLRSKSVVDGGYPDGDATGRFWLSQDRTLLVAAGYFDGYWYYARTFKRVA